MAAGLMQTRGSDAALRRKTLHAQATPPARTPPGDAYVAVQHLALPHLDVFARNLPLRSPRVA
ncbi:hypothetical protein IM53_009795 [Xanthomonas phaseoli pv. dieffenbachiae]|uniref:Uncharacterized protein n=1 Tax=Xanthomonas phaseoli pv. dieffenbachiae TaxID=92828 RepID=A0A1V9H9N4_9XANT|nr:hypothetical protein IM53_009795 [Xanthomonas phaseoli pv. dieffenbachiae]